MVLLLLGSVTMVMLLCVDLDKVWENTKEISLTTHADPRCTASCVAITTVVSIVQVVVVVMTTVTVQIALMLQGEYDVHKSKELSNLVNRSIQVDVL